MSLMLDDDFVLQQLNSVSYRWPPIEEPQKGEERRRLDRNYEDMVKLFCEHRGIDPLPDEKLLREHRGIGPLATTASAVEDEKLLKRFMDIVVQVLRLEAYLPQIEQMIQTDWIAHVALHKQKRYRDHITHPVRVTAIGWWLLHRDKASLLCQLAKDYQEKTRSYRSKEGIGIPEQWADHEVTKDAWKAIVEYAWLAAGLLHDSAYPLQYNLQESVRHRDAVGIADSVKRKFSHSRCRRTVLRPLQDSWFAAQGLDLDNRLKSLALNDFKHAHASLGALQQLRALRSVRTLQGLVLQMAARAIVTHHDRHDSQAMRADPLAYLLYVSDNLQAWGRPFLIRQSSNSAHTLRQIVECTHVELVQTNLGEFLAKYHMNKETEDMEILKGEPFNWNFAIFSEENQKLEAAIRDHPLLPNLNLSNEKCIEPRDFFEYMGG